MRLFSVAGHEPLAIAGIPGSDLTWQPIETFDHVKRPLVFLRSRDRLIAGTWARPVQRDAVSASIGPLQWGEIVEGDFIALPHFQPIEWAPIPASLFEPAGAAAAHA